MGMSSFSVFSASESNSAYELIRNEENRKIDLSNLEFKASVLNPVPPLNSPFHSCSVVPLFHVISCGG